MMTNKAVNPWKALRRAEKVQKLTDALDRELGHPCTLEDLAGMIDGQDRLTMGRAYKRARILSPSQETVNALVERISQRNAKFQGVAR